uniref:(northern house mosquito) hypothetical protein n=1 Tax=Culex pipiens TaxID=7175 RepID=A0A8D8DHM1_CULPI
MVMLRWAEAGRDVDRGESSGDPGGAAGTVLAVELGELELVAVVPAGGTIVGGVRRSAINRPSDSSSGSSSGILESPKKSDLALLISSADERPIGMSSSNLN